MAARIIAAVMFCLIVLGAVFACAPGQLKKRVSSEQPTINTIINT